MRRPLGLAVALALGCTDATGVQDLRPWSRDEYSLDPADVRVGEIIAAPCDVGPLGNRLDHLRSEREEALVDIHFGRFTANGPWDGPTFADIRLVTGHGGRVVYRFNVQALRAWIPLSRIPNLVEDGRSITVRSVPDPDRYDVPDVSVGFTRTMLAADLELFSDLGGQLEYSLSSINALSGDLPDRSIPALREHPDVVYVQSSGVGCLL